MTSHLRPRGLFSELTEGVYWFLVLDVMLLLSASPTILLWTVMSPGPLGSLLFVVAALPLLPALSAGLYACRSWREDRDLVPARQFLRGYRVNVRDSLVAGSPVLLVAALAAFNLTRSSSPALGAGEIAFLVVGAAALLVLIRALSIVSRFSFRARDVLRLSVFTLLTRPLSTLALLSLGVLTLGIVLAVGEFVLTAAASLLVFALWASERPIAQLLTEQFTTGEPAVGAEPSVSPAS